MTNLTANEITAMEMCLNYDDRGSQHSDNHSNACPADIGMKLGWDYRQLGGLLAGLTRKEMIMIDDRSAEADKSLHQNPHMHIVYLTEKGVDAIFDIIEKRAAA